MAFELWVVLVAGAAVGLAILMFGTAWVAFFPWLPRDLGGAPNLDPAARKVQIAVQKDDSIDGWFLPGRGSAVVLVLHGYGRNHHRAWRYGSFLNDAGYGVLVIDFRSSRAWKSGGRKPTTLGHHELPDAQAALGWLRDQPELSGQTIGVLGESLGGSVALLLAAANPHVGAVVVDCAFSTGAHALDDSSERWVGVPRWPTTAIARSLGRAVTGYDPGAMDAVTAAAALTERPILFIHCLRDNRLSPKQAHVLWSAAGSKDDLWTIPEAGHNEGWIKRRRQYEARVLAFFDRYLLGEGSGFDDGPHGPSEIAKPVPLEDAG
jgi:fermentation-respiration switch protein FrsA (DUF1100 family)